MKTSNLAGSVLQRFNMPLPGNNHVGRSARTSQSPRPPSDLSLRSTSADLPPRARSLPPALPVPGPAVTTQPPLRSEAPDASGQRVHANLLKAADQVGWLSSLQKDVEDQTERVLKRLIQAEKELADKPPAAGLRQLQEQVELLTWRHRALGERQQAVARMLREARQDLVQAQEQAAQQLEAQLEALEDVAQMTATLRDQACSQHETAEADIPEALLAKDAGALARLDTEIAKAHAVMTTLQQREAALDQSRETLTARLDAVQRDLAATRRQLAAAEGGVGEILHASPQCHRPAHRSHLVIGM